MHINIDTNYEKPRAFSFSNRRGRPKSERPKFDTGTPETVMKRLQGTTSEALDLCLERGIINKRQHWCGVHLRWLYTIRYGAPSVSAVQLCYYDGGKGRPEDESWRMQREKEYNDAISQLAKVGQSLLLLNLCVYNERPKFLNYSLAEMQQNFESISDSIIRLRSGLDILSDLWN